MTLDGLPGAEMVGKGLEDLAQGDTASKEALLVAMARTKLRGLGLSVPRAADQVRDAEIALYELLCGAHDDPYREYKAWRNRLGRFERALEARRGRARVSASTDPAP
jgi:hypothetical protein